MYIVIEDFPKYEINNQGDIRFVSTKKTKYTNTNKQGYKVVMFKKGGKTYSKKIHRYVAQYFLEEPTIELKEECARNYPYVVCVNHIDHDKLNNDVTNLEWCTHKHNTQESWRVGNTPALKGESNGRAVLNESLVHEMCAAFEKGMMPTKAVEVFGVSRQQATKIRAGFAWKHISEQYNIQVRRRKKL